LLVLIANRSPPSNDDVTFYILEIQVLHSDVDLVLGDHGAD